MLYDGTLIKMGDLIAQFSLLIYFNADFSFFV